jgi:hypothetical protein
MTLAPPSALPAVCSVGGCMTGHLRPCRTREGSIPSASPLLSLRGLYSLTRPAIVPCLQLRGCSLALLEGGVCMRAQIACPAQLSSPGPTVSHRDRQHPASSISRHIGVAPCSCFPFRSFSCSRQLLLESLPSSSSSSSLFRPRARPPSRRPSCGAGPGAGRWPTARHSPADTPPLVRPVLGTFDPTTSRPSHL